VERSAGPVSDGQAKQAALADRLHSLAIHLLRRVKRGDDAAGLSAPRLSALSVVIYRGPISLTELAKAEDEWLRLEELRVSLSP